MGNDWDGIERTDRDGWWCALTDGEEPHLLAVGPTEADVREQVIRRIAADEGVDTTVAAGLLDARDIGIVKCAVRVAWMNDFTKADDEPQLYWLDE